METQPTTTMKRVTPGRRKPEFKLAVEHRRLLERLARLRVLTSSQAHQLLDVFARRTERNTRKRLAAMERAGWVKSELSRPARGAFSSRFYRLAFRGLVALGLEKETYLLTRPRQHILEYLLFRNDVYSAARASGWYVASPVLHPEENLGPFLKQFSSWVLLQQQRRVAEARVAGPAALMREEAELKRLPTFLPKALTFEFLVKLDARGLPAELVLLVVDDPRRAVRRQFSNLPLLRLEGAALCLRDMDSRFDVELSQLSQPSKRLREWRRLLSEKHGQSLLATDTHFPGLWADRIGQLERSTNHSTGEEFQ